MCKAKVNYRSFYKDKGKKNQEIIINETIKTQQLD